MISDFSLSTSTGSSESTIYCAIADNSFPESWRLRLTFDGKFKNSRLLFTWKMQDFLISGPDEDERGSGLVKRPWREWWAATFEVDSDGRVAAGIDGEAAMLTPPLRFEIMPLVLRVRIARAHPGASPSAGIPDSARDTAVALMRIAGGRDQATPALHSVSDRQITNDRQPRHDGHL